MTLPADILRTIKDLARRVSNLETTPQPPNIQLSDSASVVFDLSPGSWTVLTATLSGVNGERLLATPSFSLFKDNTIAGAKLYPQGTDWGSDEAIAMPIYHWLDWGETDNSNVKLKIMIVNNTLASYTDLLFVVNWRYLARGVNTS